VKIKLIFTILIYLFFCLFLVNCSVQSLTNDQRIVGTWVHTKGRTFVLNTNGRTFMFNANGSGTGTDSDTGSMSFTYGISNYGEIYISPDNELDFGGLMYFSPDGRTLILDGDIYRKK